MEEGTQEVSCKALSIIDQGKAIVIKNSADYITAGELWITIKGIMKQVESSFDPIITKAHQAHKEAVAQKAKIYDPLKAVYVSVKGLMNTYDAEQERIRKDEEKRLQEIARKIEEDRILQEAVQAEVSGDTKEANTIIETPVYVPPVVIPKSVPKMTGGPVFRTIWKYRILNTSAIPRGYLIPDEIKIGQVVRALKRETSIPGIEVYEERC